MTRFWFIAGVALTAATLAILLLAASSSASNPGLVAGLIGSGQSGTPHGTSRLNPHATKALDADVGGVGDEDRSPAGGVPQTQVGTALIGGRATWYDDGAGLYGAAGPVLRDALGGDPAFRGEVVTVCADACVTIVLSDWCACGDRGGVPTIVDLSADAFARLAPLSRGVIDVTIELGGSVPTLPPTDTEEP